MRNKINNKNTYTDILHVEILISNPSIVFRYPKKQLNMKINWIPV